MEPPPVQFTKIRGGWVGYQVAGDGPRDIVFIPAFIGGLDSMWAASPLSRLMRHLASIGRMITVDRRGCGVSDRLPPGASFLEEWMADVVGVMEVVGSQEAVLLGIDTASPMALYLAAAVPDRVSSLVLVQPFARSIRDDDYLIGAPRHLTDALVQFVDSSWGDGTLMATVNPSADVPRELYARAERQAMTRTEAVEAVKAWSEVDVRGVLSSVRCPVLVIYQSRVQMIPAVWSRYVADNLPDAAVVELDHADLHGWINVSMDESIRIIDEFLAVDRSIHATDRSLATLLFSDIVRSTQRAAAVGDANWTEILDVHDAAVRVAVETNEGAVVKTTGDGALATFDGPARAIRAARQIRDALTPLRVTCRMGIHTGEVQQRAADVAGMAVVIASRVSELAAEGEILVTRTVKDLVVGSDHSFADRGTHELKGVPDTWQLYAVA